MKIEELRKIWDEYSSVSYRRDTDEAQQEIIFTYFPRLLAIAEAGMKVEMMNRLMLETEEFIAINKLRKALLELDG